jgi:hypothetical protein
MVLSGAMVPLPLAARAPASSSWAFQAILGIGGAGSDVDRDACWDLPREEREEYQEKIEAWQEEFTDLEVKRAIAIGPVESAIEAFKDDFDWTFLNKRDREKYLNTIFGTWGAQVVIIVVLFAGTVFMQKRRDVA